MGTYYIFHSRRAVWQPGRRCGMENRRLRATYVSDRPSDAYLLWIARIWPEQLEAEAEREADEAGFRRARSTRKAQRRSGQEGIATRPPAFNAKRLEYHWLHRCFSRTTPRPSKLLPSIYRTGFVCPVQHGTNPHYGSLRIRCEGYPGW